MVDVFLDTDVAFDLISKREPFFTDALPCFKWLAGGKSSFRYQKRAWPL